MWRGFLVCFVNLVFSQLICVEKYAQTFSLFCSCLGYPTRLVVDLTDHVWTEVKIGGKWLHADTGESSLDKPLLYEAGWGKKLTYCFAVNSREVVDVTPRYTQQFASVLARRELCSEDWLEAHLSSVRRQLESELSPEQAALLHEEHARERLDLFGPNSGNVRPIDPEEAVGRRTGDAAWHSQRGENTF
jgi:peptide-N4-(N-acetyl-beta-glucosaminyl)asparagine amidase